MTSNGYEVSFWSEENVESGDDFISTIELYFTQVECSVCELYLNNVVIITETVSLICLSTENKWYHIHIVQVYASITDAKKAKIDWFYEDYIS